MKLNLPTVWPWASYHEHLALGVIVTGAFLFGAMVGCAGMSVQKASAFDAGRQSALRQFADELNAARSANGVLAQLIELERHKITQMDEEARRRDR